MYFGQNLYYMIFISDSKFLNFWGKAWIIIENSSGIAMLLIFLTILPVAVCILNCFLKNLKKSIFFGFTISLILNLFIFDKVVYLSGNIFKLAMSETREYYSKNPEAFENWETELERYKNFKTEVQK